VVDIVLADMMVYTAVGRVMDTAVGRVGMVVGMEYRSCMVVLDHTLLYYECLVKIILLDL